GVYPRRPAPDGGDQPRRSLRCCLRSRGPGQSPAEEVAMRRAAVWLLCATALAIQGAAFTGGGPKPVESWCSPGLKVTAGLELWLDASRQNAARKAHGRPELQPGQPLDTWYDASGNRRH